MKKTLLLLPLFLIIFSSTALAASVTLDNYHWIHTNSIGNNQFLKDKRGAVAIQGDAQENDAYITNVQLETEGMNGVTLYIVFPDGSKQTVSNGVVAITKRVKSISIAVDKTSNKETWVAVRILNTDDASNGGTSVSYSYTLNTPTRFGDLGNGTDNGGVDPVDPVDPTPNPTFVVTYSPQSRKLTWNTVPNGTYEVVLTYPDGTKKKLTPTTKVFRIDDSISGEVKVQTVKLDGTVITSKMITVQEGITDPTDPNPIDPNPTDPDPPDCLCPDLCEMLPILLGGISSDIQGLRMALHEDLQGVNNALNEINNNTAPLHQDLGNINRVLDVVQANTAPIHGDLVYISDLLNETLRQITPVRDYALPTPIVKPPLYKPNDVMPAPYTNNKTYFTDQGDAPTPDAMPMAPEPENWTDQNGNKMNKDQEIVKQPVMTREPELQKAEDMIKEPDMQRDTEVKQDTPLQVEKETYRLRWKSSEFP